MRARIRRLGRDVVVELDGDADLAAAPRLAQVLTRATAQATGAADAIVVDLDGVVVLDDTALGLLVGAAARARRSGIDLVLVCTDGRLRERLAETCVDRIVEIRTPPG